MRLILIVISIYLLTGCSAKKVQLEPINSSTLGKYMIFYERGPEPKRRHYYKLFGVYDNNESNLKKLQAILKKQKEEYSKIESTSKSKLTKLSYKEKYDYCYTQVIGRQYGSFRNVIERDSLIERCISDKGGSKRSYNTGTHYKAYLFSPDYLSIDIKNGQGRRKIETWQKIQIMPIENKLYFFMTMSKNYMKENALIRSMFLSGMNMMIKDSNLISDNPMVVQEEDFLLKD